MALSAFNPLAKVARRATLLIVSGMGTETVVRYLRNPDPRITVPLLRARGAKVGLRTRFKRSLFLDNTMESKECAGDFRNLCVGSNCYVGDLVFMDLSDQILVEDNVVISGSVSLLTHSDCNRSHELAALFPRRTAPIILERGCWIGSGATLLAGTRIGSRAVIAAGAVVTKSVEAGTVHAGVPAAKIRTLTF